MWRRVEAWKSVQADLLPRTSSAVDRRVRQHQAVLDKWDAALQDCEAAEAAHTQRFPA